MFRIFSAVLNCHVAGQIKLAALGAALCLAPASVSYSADSHSGPHSDERIISVGGAITEIVYQLEAGDRLVANDTTSRYPEAADGLPKVGYQRALSAEGLLSMRPSLILASHEAGPASALDRVEKTGVRVVRIHGDDSPAGVIKKIEAVSNALEVPEKGKTLISKLESEFAALAAKRTATQSDAKPRVLFLLNVGRGAPMIAGQDTSADSIIAMAGADNVIRSHKGYKPINPEAVIVAKPEVLLMTNRTLRLSGGIEGVLKLPGLATTPAARNKRVIAMDGLLLLGFGPRTPQAAEQLSERLANQAAQLSIDLAAISPRPRSARGQQ